MPSISLNTQKKKDVAIFSPPFPSSFASKYNFKQVLSHFLLPQLSFGEREGREGRREVIKVEREKHFHFDRHKIATLPSFKKKNDNINHHALAKGWIRMRWIPRSNATGSNKFSLNSVVNIDIAFLSSDEARHTQYSRIASPFC
jgi:hypothetical protein